MSVRDRIFDGLADKFADSLYGKPRGELRLALLDELLPRTLALHGQPALDAGGGLGQMSAWLARRGHPVTLAEPSVEMLERARREHGDLPIDFLRAPLQELGQVAPGPWPLIVCHAVLEWLAEPRRALATLNRLLAPGGQLSLMVFNRDALRFSNVVKGNLEKALDDRLAGTGQRQRLTPISPLTHARVSGWFAEEGLVVEHVAGIRIFHDYLRERDPDDTTLSRLFELERRYCDVDPHWRLGRYLLYHLRKPEIPGDGT
ncbi:methyltransferase domain-containing protein [Modicisalibacter radicis]|uniref:methyltransferase domain-containing protein n=1 Tax=Halomonas sp. EAR18 TaxID=2518972 RepID=UPI00109C228E|nr:methyltransferase domain-containing protein [Halomonas sp. EAR18]